MRCNKIERESEYSINLIYDSGFHDFPATAPIANCWMAWYKSSLAQSPPPWLPVDVVIVVDVVNLYALFMCSLSISGHLSQFVGRAYSKRR